jgi:hypothetical protein
VTGTSRPCPYCKGGGCEECGHTGRRVRTVVDVGDGITMSVSGSVDLTQEETDALASLARIALDRHQASVSSEPGGEG